MAAEDRVVHKLRLLFLSSLTAVQTSIIIGLILICVLAYKGNEFLSYFYIFATRCRRPLIFHVFDVRLNIQSLKYLWFTPSCCKDIGMRKFEFVAKTQFP